MAWSLTKLFHTFSSLEEAIAAHIERPTEMDIDYLCVNCGNEFNFHVTDDEMRTSLESSHLERCPKCGPQEGGGRMCA
jgi:DNA-directed RNA polymerase subunit RPC12/RpoP